MSVESDLEQVKAAQRKLHETIQEAKLVQAELDETVRVVKETVNNLIETAVADGLETYSAAIERAIENATNRVNERFDKIAEILMGEERRQKRQGLPSIQQLADQLAEKGKHIDG